MIKNLINKGKLMLMLALLMLVCVCASGLTGARADTTFNGVDDLSLTIKQGEVVVQGEDGVSGLEFTISLPQAEYEAMISTVGSGKAYKSVETGVVIAPSYYATKSAFTKETLFGADAVYDWATYSGSTDKWNYVDAGKIRVVNINTNLWEDEGSVYTYSGAIVDILEDNEAEDFLSVGYIRLIDSAGVETVKFTANVNAVVASTALEAIVKGQFTDAEKQWALENWINDKIDVQSQQVVSVDVDALSSTDYSIFEAVKVDFDTYRLIKGIKDKSQMTISLTDANKNVKYLNASTGAVIDLSAAENLRVWSVDISYGDYSLWKGEVDFYSLTGGFVWNDEISTDSVDSYNISDPEKDGTYDKYNYNYNGSAKAEVVDGVTVLSYTKSGDNGSWYVWKPLHGKAYYENFTGKGLAISITISTVTSTTDKVVLNQGYIWGSSDYIADAKENRSLTRSISIDDIVSNWDKIIIADWDHAWGTRSTYGMVHAYNITNGGTFQISNLKIVIDGDLPSVEGQDFVLDLDKEQSISSVDISSYIDESVLDVCDSYGEDSVSCDFVGKYSDDKFSATDLTAIDMSNVAQGLYTLYVRIYGVTIFTAVVDIRSSTNVNWTSTLSSQNLVVGRAETDSLGWSEAALTTLNKGDGYELIDAVSITDTTHPLYGKTGKFLKVTSIAAAEQIALSVKPIHEFEYYKNLLQGKDYVLTFDFYFTGGFRGMSGVGAYYNKDTRFSDYITWRGSINDKDKWVSFSLPFDSYLLCQSASDSFSGKYVDYNNLGTKVSSSNAMFQFETNQVGSVIYMGAPHIETMPDVVHWSSTAKSIDYKGGYDYDLTQILSTSEKAKYSYLVEKYGYDKIFFRIKFSDSSSTIIWANEDGSVNLNLSTVVGTTDAGASITVADKLLLGGFTIDARLCDLYNFPGHTSVGVFGTVGGANNNQKIISTGTITANNLPEPVEVYEIAVFDGTVKILRDDYSSKRVSSTINEGNAKSITVNSVQDLTKIMSVKAFKNEVEASQIQLVSKANTSYRIVLNDLKSGSNVLSKENISLYHMLYTQVVGTYGALSPLGVGEYPDAILPMDVAIKNSVNTLTAGKNQGVWISFSIPIDQPAGEYTGTFMVQLGSSFYDIPVSVTVYDYAVAEETHMKTTMSLVYTDILNLETPYEYDSNGKVVVNSSGDKDGVLSQEIIDAYSKYMADHRIGASHVMKTDEFSGSWQGYPYDPTALFSFSTFTSSGVRRKLYEYPLRTKDSNGNTAFVTTKVNKTGYETAGYPLYLDRVDEYFNQIVKLAQNPRASMYRIPVQQATASNFNNDNIASLYSSWAGQMNEIRKDMPDGVKAYVINRLVLRDLLEMLFVKTMDLYDAGTEVDVFKKAMVSPGWIDEFGINESKTLNAQYLLEGMKDFFPSCSTWLRTVYSSRVSGNEFLLSVLDSLSNIKVYVTSHSLESLDPSLHDANYIAVLDQYSSEELRNEATEWANTVYGGEGEKWVYTAMNDVFPNASMLMEVPLLSTRMTGWMMSEYDISGFLYWATMKSKYLDNIWADKIQSVIGETVQDGEIIKLDDFYNNAIHYSMVAGDGFLLYPGSYYNMVGPVGTLRLEALTDSIEEYNLFYDLKAAYKNAGVEEGFYNVMRRLSEMLYTDISCKVVDGYTTDFTTSRESLANMLILARDNGVYVLDVYLSGSTWCFDVATPADVAEAFKSGVGATFRSSEDITLSGISGKKLTFEVPSTALSSGYLEIPYANKLVKLSIETLVETVKVESFVWANVNSSATTTYHLSNYSNGANGTSANISIVNLSESNSVGGRTSGSYFHVAPSSTSDTSNLGFAVLPSSSLDWGTVNAYKDKAVLKFDVYMETKNIADGSLRETQKIWFSLGKSSNTSTDAHKWFTVTITFSTILENWDTLMNTSAATYSNWSTSQRALFAVNGSSHSAAGVHTTSFYIGNFRIKHA